LTGGVFDWGPGVWIVADNCLTSHSRAGVDAAVRSAHTQDATPPPTPIINPSLPLLKPHPTAPHPNPRNPPTPAPADRGVERDGRQRPLQLISNGRRRAERRCSNPLVRFEHPIGAGNAGDGP